MPSLNLDLDWFTHRKAVRLVGLLGPGADFLPLKLWVYAGKYHPEDGQLIGYSKGEIESIVGWTGEAGKFIDAMMTPGIELLEQHENIFQVHDWLEHAGHLAVFKKRAKTAAKKRWKKYASSIAKTARKQSSSRGNVRYSNARDLKEGEGLEGETKEPAWPSPQTLVKLYNDLTPDECPEVTTLSPARRDKAKNYLSMFPKREFWETVFQRVHHSRFLRGINNSNGHRDFKFDFDWMLTKGKDGSENCVKVFEGRYQDDRK